MKKLLGLFFTTAFTIAASAQTLGPPAIHAAFGAAYDDGRKHLERATECHGNFVDACRLVVPGHPFE
jgi:hypothetical protein